MIRDGRARPGGRADDRARRPAWLLHDGVISYWAGVHAKLHRALQCLKVGLHGQRHAELLGEEGLRGLLAQVDAHGLAPALGKVPASLDLDAAALGARPWDLDVHRLARAHEPLEERGRDARVELRAPLGVGEDFAEPRRHLGEPRDDTCSKSGESVELGWDGRVSHGVDAKRDAPRDDSLGHLAP